LKEIRPNRFARPAIPLEAVIRLRVLVGISNKVLVSLTFFAFYRDRVFKTFEMLIEEICVILPYVRV
jgi:hypothetical protein